MTKARFIHAAVVACYMCRHGQIVRSAKRFSLEKQNVFKI